MGKRKKEKFEDDGRVIANMNVEGMPWYVQRPGPQEKSRPRGGSSAPRLDSAQSGEPPKPTRKEQLAMMKGVLQASMLVTAVFVAVFTLFILFCIFIWLR